MYKLYKIYRAARTAAAVTVGVTTTVVVSNSVYNHFVDGDQSEKVANSLIDRAQLNEAASPEYNNQRKREKNAKEKMDQQQASMSESLKANLPDPEKDDGGGPKRPLKPEEVAVGAVVLTVGAIQEFTNPDPTKEAHEAHQKKVEEKRNQKPQDPPREKGLVEKFINWISN